MLNAALHAAPWATYDLLGAGGTASSASPCSIHWRTPSGSSAAGGDAVALGHRGGRATQEGVDGSIPEVRTGCCHEIEQGRQADEACGPQALGQVRSPGACIFRPDQRCKQATQAGTRRRRRAAPSSDRAGRTAAQSPLPGRNRPDFSREHCMGLQVDGPVPDPGGRRVLAEIVVAFPVPRRPDGPRREATASIWAHVAQYCVDASGTECALVAADARFD